MGWGTLPEFYTTSSPLSGLMWENAPQFGALLLFAEHRYYGQSQPFAPYTQKRLEYLRLGSLTINIYAGKQQKSFANGGCRSLGGRWLVCLCVCSSEQALADYATLIRVVKEQLGAPVSLIEQTEMAATHTLF